MEQTYAHVNDNIPASEKRKYWETAFGLQAVDELKPSRYLRQLASEHIAGEKSYAEVRSGLDTYYESIENPNASEHEADDVSAAIYNILEDESFRFDIITLKSYHRRLFEELPKEVYHPGEFRKVNLTKREPILDGETVHYVNYTEIEETLKYDFAEELSQDYLKMSDKEKVARFAEFTSKIWQVHPFYEGNTRTTAVFIQKYLRNLGYKVDNELFRDHSRFFRDALVKANYSNIPKSIKSDPSYLHKFFENLLFSKNNDLKF